MLTDNIDFIFLKNFLQQCIASYDNTIIAFPKNSTLDIVKQYIIQSILTQ